MNHPNRYRSAGFTMVELMMAMAIAGILSGLAVANYSNRWGQERLLGASRTMHAWLDEQRRIAMQQGGACKIKINTTNARLDPTDPTITLPDSSTTTNVCANRGSFLIQESVKNGAQIQLRKSSINSNADALIFSFRGFSQIAKSNDTWSTQPQLELRLSMSGVSRERCIKVVNPLGLIRNGFANTTDGDCIYNTSS
jgi:prepilin-type N-terminal cleavage/methylation domain-containing protein